MNNTSLTDVHLDLEALPNSNLVAISALSAGSSNKIYVTSVALDHSLVFSTAAQSAAMSFNALVV
ncbi:MAG: hypothetical protein EPO09_21220 [Aquabacterium sp.]|uniref:hypothetical protein n=1 Tax=Aquabacterium sp. TaxID=1872578 RepID=UPI0011F9B8E1|nr:hypothetical protein [Aquabacterium sp.]TAK83617.1 MAG: hypothetical protein EPO09_21220 [Aquabacterium sp.]